MTQTTRVPAEVFHPSEFIQDEMDARGWDRDDLATQMVGMVGGEAWGLARLSLDFYLEIGAANPDLRIGQESARAFGTSAVFWTNLETAWLAGVQK